MLTLVAQLLPERVDWQQTCAQLSQATSLAALVVQARQIGMEIARCLVESQLQQRATAPTDWGRCPRCSSPLCSKGPQGRQVQTLVGEVCWHRRVGRCPHHCKIEQVAPFDERLGILPNQATSSELQRLGLLLAVIVPFELAAVILDQLCGVAISPQSIWNWTQQQGEGCSNQSDTVALEPLNDELAQLPMLIAADGITVPFRTQPKTPQGAVVWREVKVGLVTRYQSSTREQRNKTQLGQRRLVAVLGDVDALASLLKAQALRQGWSPEIASAWISDGAKGLWRVYQEQFAQGAVGILDFYHAVQHLAQAAAAYGQTLSTRSPQQWLARMRHQLRQGYAHRIIQELDKLIHYDNTPRSAIPVLRQVQDYLQTHLAHVQYRKFKALNLPLDSGLIESACKGLIAQRFKGTGMRWSEDGFNHLLRLRLDWMNGRFATSGSDALPVLSLYSPNL
ncbi:MAG: ISKra4 family transposase [Elainella sp.]